MRDSFPGRGVAAVQGTVKEKCGDELWITCRRRGEGENPSLLCLDHAGTRVLGWVSVLSLLSAKTACVFHCYQSGISCQL